MQSLDLHISNGCGGGHGKVWKNFKFRATGPTEARIKASEALKYRMCFVNGVVVYIEFGMYLD